MSLTETLGKLFFTLLNGVVAWNSWCCFLQTENIVFKPDFEVYG